MEKRIVVGSLDSIQGEIKTAHIECEIDLDLWNSLSHESRRSFLEHYGRIVIDDFEIKEYGEILNVSLISKGEDNELRSNT